MHVSDDVGLLRRAARLYRIPGVSRAEVCARLGISKAGLARARASADLSDYAWTDDLLLSALTDTGKQTSGRWPGPAQLSKLASYLDFVNKDGSTAATVETMLDELVRRQVLRRHDEGFELLEPFP